MSLQALGLGKLKPNTLLIGYKSDWIKADPRDVFDYYNVIQYVHTQKSVISCILGPANKILILISHAKKHSMARSLTFGLSWVFSKRTEFRETADM